MPRFATLPFQDQIVRIESLAASSADPRPLLREAGALADVEPFAHLLAALARSGRLGETILAEIAELLEALRDPALAHVYGRAEPGSALERALLPLSLAALRTWPLARISALSFLARWHRRRAPEAHTRFLDEARSVATRAPAQDAGRWLLFVDGAHLTALEKADAWAATVAQTVEDVIDALARAPKSISQANAEALLARSVYADPGHFFFELLQNADDAGASRWEARVEEGRVVIVHDGAPFSFRDLLGMLSIGQTTKRSEQIGFFGVGFKSVYEVCDRPRVHSGVFDFEIAHVSIARVLQERPAEADDGATVLVLPHREGLDPAERAALHGRALALPPETLLTLPHLRSMSVTGPGGETCGWTEEGDSQVVTLRSSAGEVRAYHRVERAVSFEGERPEGRPKRSRVLVAIRLDSDGRPIANEGPSIFSFLPTAERAGIRVLAHARFDVTLDRERLERGSVWNERLLHEAGIAAAEGIATLARAGQRIAEVLPTFSELTPLAGPYGAALRAHLFEQPCLRRPGGGLVAPARARVLSEPLAVALAALDLGDGDRALACDDPRLAEVAHFLGARTFDADDLPALIAREVKPGDPRPAWLTEPLLMALAAARVDDAQLRALPLLLDGEARLRSAEAARVAPPEWVALYRGVRPLVSPAELARLPATLARRLDVARFGAEALVEDLWDDTMGPRLIERDEALLQVLETLEGAQLGLLDDLPLLASEGGPRHAVSGRLRRLEGELEVLREPLAKAIPLVPAERVEAHAVLLDAWVRPFGLSELAAWLEGGAALGETVFGETATDLLLGRLDACAARLPYGLAMRFAALPLFLDRGGARRPLIGPGRATRTGHVILTKVLPDWPWLARDAGPFLDAVRLDDVDAPTLAAALIGEGDLPAVGDDVLEAVLGWLAARARELPASTLDHLAEAPLWLDEDFVPRRLEALRPGDGSPAVCALLETLDTRRVAHPAFAELAHAMSLGHRLPKTDLHALVHDLSRLAKGSDDVAPALSRAALMDALEEAAASLSPSELRPLRKAPLFLDGSGVARPLGDWSTRDPGRCHRAGALRSPLAHGPLPLLDEAEEALLPRFLSAVGSQPPSVFDLMTYVREDPSLATDPDALLAAFASSPDALDAGGKEALARLPLFRDRRGDLRAATELSARMPFADALGERRLATLALSMHFFDASSEARVAELGLESRPARDLLEREILSMLREGVALVEQPAPWNGVGDLVALLELTDGLGVDLLAHPLVVDALRRLARGPKMGASEAVRALAPSLRDRLIDVDLERSLPPRLARALVHPLPVHRVAQALRDRDDDADLDAASLYAWIRSEGQAIEADVTALGALGAAAVIASQGGGRRAPRQLVLDPTIPDLGLAWGVAADVPADVARWLARVFPFDRKQRRALVERLLDGIDEAARADEPARASELVRFLSRALGAGEVPPEELEAQVRRLDVRARLKVPLRHGGWGKPRHAWTGSAADASHVAAFLQEVPPRIALPGLDEPARALLCACGADPELDEARVLSCLDGRGRLPGTPAHVALAEHVIDRVARDPGLLERWKLAGRRWVPDRDGRTRRARDLIWPDQVCVALLGESHEALVHPEVAFGATAAPPAGLGFRRARDLTLADIAPERASVTATDALLDWLEQGLVSGALETSAVRETFRERLLLLDDDGRRRVPAELAHAGARAAFGSWRGDYVRSTERPRLTRALGIPSRPDAVMMLAFVEEAGAALDDLTDDEAAELSRYLPSCLEALGEAVESGHELRLPPGAAVAGLRGDSVVLARITDASLRILEPKEIAAALPASALETVVDPLPALDRGRGVRRLLFGAGVADLFGDFVVSAVARGPRLEQLDAEAKILHDTLTRSLRQDVGATARVVERLTLDGTLTLRTRRFEVRAAAEVAVHDGTLWLTPEALRDPRLLAPWLAPEASRRLSMERWLEEGDLARAPKRLRERRTALAQAAPEVAESWLAQRMRRWFGGDGGVPEPPPPRKRRRAEVPTSPREEAFFRPQTELTAQLGRDDGWLESRRDRPAFGFAFNPPRLEAPWLYAPKLVAVRFDRRTQRWASSPLQRPMRSEGAGHLVLDGKLPAGSSILPIPLYGQLEDVRADGAQLSAGQDGSVTLRLAQSARVRLAVSLFRVPALDRCLPAALPEALVSFVPDAELPDEALDAVASLDPDAPAVDNALVLRDFVRARYRYDPSYLEDPGVSRFLARLTRGRANAHVAALHAGADASHLGAGVCYELNSLVCELLRRAQIPAAIATGWVLEGGALSEPDHLFALALLETPEGTPAWVPVDASTTRRGRPLRIARRPPGRFRAPRDPRAKAPAASPWDLGWGSGERRARRQRAQDPSAARSHGARSARKQRRPPRAELLRLLRYLERKTGRTLSPAERIELERALGDDTEAARMLKRLLGR